MIHSKFEMAADLALLAEVLTQFPHNQEVMQTIDAMLRMIDSQKQNMHVTGEEFVEYIEKKYNFD